MLSVPDRVPEVALRCKVRRAMTVAPHGDLTLQLNKLASWPVAAIAGLGQPRVSSGPGGDHGLRLDPTARPNCAPARRVYPSRAAICRGLDCLRRAGYVTEVERTCEYTRPSRCTRALPRHRCGRRNASA